MIEFVAKLDQYTTDFLNENYPGSVPKLHGFTELVVRKTQTFPVVINGTGDRSNVQVALDDKFNFITWVRIPGSIGLTVNEDESWGLKEGRQHSVALRWVIAHRVEFGESLILQLVNSIPVILQNVTGYIMTFAGVTSIDFDHEAIYRTELGETVYEKHRFDWNLYAIEISIEYIVC